ncbi:hypothetical protein CDAR_504901 [Caerostris darwini]|uniref:Uncharacterized protein n=1 Tax=Caerostris darwini TaxID=1538125 RepID=A0AAV4MQW0_9ARAC|nr:hypothetical protein CDAR_504901 [Caerostris darwini]
MPSIHRIIPTQRARGRSCHTNFIEMLLESCLICIEIYGARVMYFGICFKKTATRFSDRFQGEVATQHPNRVKDSFPRNRRSIVLEQRLKTDLLAGGCGFTHFV